MQYKRLTKDGRSLTRMRGGIALANKYRFQFYEHRGELFIHMEIESLTFKGSEGSATFGDPVELNLNATIKELLSGCVFLSNMGMDGPNLTNIALIVSNSPCKAHPLLYPMLIMVAFYLSV